MKCLISYVSTNDPWKVGNKESGPYSTLTAFYAIQPKSIHLIYTPATQSNCLELQDFLGNSDSDIQVHVYMLEIDDPTNYDDLKDEIPPLLSRIKRQEFGRHFYLVSGLAQPRFIFALCIANTIIDGVLLEAVPPKSEAAWPQSQAEYLSRIKSIDLEFFRYFREQSYQRFQEIRLKLDPNTEKAWIDGKTLDLRARSSVQDQRGEFRNRSFYTLLLFALEALYGRKKGIVTKEDLRKTVFSDQFLSGRRTADANIRKAILRLNKQSKMLSDPQKGTILPLIEDVTHGKKYIGQYRLARLLQPYPEKIEIVGDLSNILENSPFLKESHSLRQS